MSTFTERRMVQRFEEIVADYAPVAVDLGHPPTSCGGAIGCGCGLRWPFDRNDTYSFLAAVKLHIEHVKLVARVMARAT